jgi:ribosomal protein L11 methyltransferase
VAWWQLSVQCSADELEQTETSLLALGAISITLCDAHDEPIYEPLPGDTPVWQHSIMTGMFEQQLELEGLYDQLLNLLPDHQVATVRKSTLEDQNWERTHLQHFSPIRCADNLWIVPSWLEPPDPRAINIQLDPGLAFGTGSHPTTALCLAWMADKDFSNQSVIDYGCGSGILSIAACKLGANKVYGVDIDPQAVDASLENARRNDIDPNLIQITPPSMLNIHDADLLIANILSGPLIDLAPKFADLLKPGAKILLSGILKAQVNDIKSAYQPWFELEPKTIREDWARVTGTRKYE